MKNAVHDVLVLGAGAAGLAAAAVLAKAGQRVALIEARQRIGGRIFTEHFRAPGSQASFPIELGAEFIHGLPEESWRLVKQAQLATRELSGTHLRYTDGTLRASDDGSIGGVFDAMSQWLEPQPRDFDATFADFLQRSNLGAAARAASIRYVEGFNAADHRVIGLVGLERQQQAEDRIQGDRLFHIVDGYDALPAYLLDQSLAADAQLHLSTTIDTVRWNAGDVTMAGFAADGAPCTFRGTRAIVTLPLGVLQSAAVRFDPTPATALPEARRLAMDSVVRIPLTFRSRFWAGAAAKGKLPEVADDLERLSFLLTDQKIATWWTQAPERTPMLTAWVGGPASRRLQRITNPGSSQPIVIDDCIAALAAVFGEPAAAVQNELESWHFHDWDADPLSLGAYSYAPAGAADVSARLAEPIERTLYFAGEHTTTSGHWGTVHGAIQSGEAAASKILHD